MVEGDKWEIYVPYELGYESTGSYDSNGNLVIPPYSTLVFEIEIVDVIQ
jgi:FKBP-type peptidyl-prolyl cis-trans isomerase